MYWLHPDVDAACEGKRTGTGWDVPHETPPLPPARADSDTAQHQFYFGPDIWTAPIAAPAPNGTGGLTNWTFWVPPGRWIEWGRCGGRQ